MGVFLANSLMDAEACVLAAQPTIPLKPPATPGPVGSTIASLLISADSAWLADKDRLWEVVSTSVVEQRLRVQCLTELAQRKDSQLPAFLVQQLAVQLHTSPQVDAMWRDTLLSATEQTAFVEPALRAQMQSLLIQHACLLRDQPGGQAQGPLWAALRRYATMIPAAQVGDLLGFLRAEDAPLTRQVALQCIQNVFSVEPPSEGLDLRAVRAQVHSMALEYLRPDRAATSEDRTLAVNAFRSALALDDPEAPELLAALIAMRLPHMLWLSRDQLQRVALSWTRHAETQQCGAMSLKRLNTYIEGLNRALVELAQNQVRGV